MLSNTIEVNFEYLW